MNESHYLKPLKSAVPSVPSKIGREFLEKIIEMAEKAPAAGSCRQTGIVVCQNAEINERTGKIHTVLMQKYRAREGMSFTQEEADQAVSSFYSAPCVITFFSPGNFASAARDIAILIDRICLLACANDHGACMIGEVMDTYDTDYGKYLKKTGHTAELPLLWIYSAGIS